MGQPKILTKNFISADCTITVSHGDGSKDYLYDRDNDSAWLTSGANDDTTVASIEVVFKEGTTAVDRTIDRLLLINHNLKNWDFYTWNGSTWVLQANEDADAADIAYKTFASVTTSKVKIECDSTQVADAEKFIGEMIVASLQMELTEDLTAYDRRDREKNKTVTLGDGSEHKMVTRWTRNRATKYEARATIMLLDGAGHDWREDRLILKAISDARIPFLFYPESDENPDEIFLVRWDSPWSQRYISPYKGSGIEVPLEVSEV